MNKVLTHTSTASKLFLLVISKHLFPFTLVKLLVPLRLSIVVLFLVATVLLIVF